MQPASFYSIPPEFLLGLGYDVVAVNIAFGHFNYNSQKTQLPRKKIPIKAFGIDLHLWYDLSI
ncbi:MAG: hypothetical protein FWG20_05605 [Candidatus Cloacimonetes bacterium]|nr:hypothetical protein [Candidatus Cloacimonadota bacterium]